MIRAMQGNGIWKGASLLFSLLGGLFVLAWAGGLIWHGRTLLGTGVPELDKAGFTLVGFGMFLLVPLGINIVFRIMKARAPAKRSERPTEPEEVTFDADAAMARYLARKAEGGAAPGSAGSAQPIAPPAQRPVFGRRGDPA